MTHATVRGSVTAAFVLAFALGACGGPSTQEISAARAARYDADVKTIFEIGIEAARANYHKILDADVAQGAFITQGKWYSPDGQSESAGVGNSVQVVDGSLYVQLLVKVAHLGTGLQVEVTPVIERFRMGVGEHEKVEPGDPSLPGWVQGKADALAVAIYERAKQYAR